MLINADIKTEMYTLSPGEVLDVRSPHLMGQD